MLIKFKSIEEAHSVHHARTSKKYVLSHLDICCSMQDSANCNPYPPHNAIYASHRGEACEQDDAIDL